MELNNVLRTAKTYARNRILKISGGNTRFKINSRQLDEELVTAAVFGELSCLERLMAVIVDDKDITKEEIEAELHLAIVDYYNFMKDKFQHKTPINLDRYLQMRGYFNKDVASAQVISTDLKSWKA